jgi:hypothetical protein
VQLVPQQEGIAEIKCMSMEDSAAQDVRQDSPVYEEMINATSRVANSVLREYER